MIMTLRTFSIQFVIQFEIIEDEEVDEEDAGGRLYSDNSSSFQRQQLAEPSAAATAADLGEQLGLGSVPLLDERNRHLNSLLQEQQVNM